MRLEVNDDDFGKGGMRIAKKATVLEGLNHDLLKPFPKGANVLLKHYNDDVMKAAEEKNRSVKSIAKKVSLTMCKITVESFVSSMFITVLTLFRKFRHKWFVAPWSSSSVKPTRKN